MSTLLVLQFVVMLKHKSTEQTRASEIYPMPQGEVKVAWDWDGETFRLDIAAPHSVALDIALPMRAATVYVNGETVWGNRAFQENRVGVTAAKESPAGLHLACPSGGAYHVLACAG